MLIYLIPFFIFIIFLIIYTLPVNIKIEYSRIEEDDEFRLDIYTFIRFLGMSIYIPYFNNKLIAFFTEFFAEIDLFFLKKKSNYKNVDIEEEVEWEKIHLDKLKKILFLIMDKNLNRIIFDNLKIYCKSFYWRTEYGMSNPAITGISNGLFWILKGIIVQVISIILNFNNPPELYVKPDFDEEKFSTYFSGIFSLHLGNIILTTMKILIYKLDRIKIKRIISLKIR